MLTLGRPLGNQCDAMIIVNLDDDLSHNAYEALLDFAASHAHVFFLVNQFELPENLNPFLSQAQPFLVEKRITHKWPGTTRDSTLGTAVPVLHYQITADSITLLKTTCTSLYDWQTWSEPPLPEDLGFLRADGRVLLASVAHEDQAWLELEPSEYREFLEIARRAGIAFSADDEGASPIG